MIIKRRKISDTDEKLPSEIVLVSEDVMEMELFQGMYELNKEGGLIPTLDIITEMINNKELVRKGDKWVRSVPVCGEPQAKKNCPDFRIMYG